MDEQRFRQVLTERMTIGPGEPWFEAAVDEADRFVSPDFSISQIFFTQRTAAALVQALDGYAAPCCLCTPRLAYEWFQRGRRVMLLDIDPRFEGFSDFIQCDLREPQLVDREFDVIVADPPFFIPEPVHRAIRVLTGDHRPDLFMVFACEHEDALLRLFAEYRLQPINFDLHHCNVKSTHQSRFRLYGSRPELFSALVGDPIA